VPRTKLSSGKRNASSHRMRARWRLRDWSSRPCAIHVGCAGRAFPSADGWKLGFRADALRRRCRYRTSRYRRGGNSVQPASSAFQCWERRSGSWARNGSHIAQGTKPLCSTAGDEARRCFLIRASTNQALGLRPTAQRPHGSLHNQRMMTSARCRSDGGIASRSLRAVMRLMANTNCLGCSIGKSSGCAPRRILSTYSAVRRKTAF